MRGPTVVALEEVVDHHLPVGAGLRRHEAPCPAGDQLVVHRQVGANVVGEPRRLSRQRRRRLVEIDEREVEEPLGPHLGEADGVALEVGHRLRAPRVLQPPVQVVGPGVVRADEPLLSALPLDQRMGAMGARVVERADLAVRIADQEELLVVNASGDELAGGVEPAAMRGELPASVEDGLLLRLEDLGVDVVACSEGGGAIRLRVMRLLVEQAGDRGRVHASHLLTLSERYRITVREAAATTIFVRHVRTWTRFRPA